MASAEPPSYCLTCIKGLEFVAEDELLSAFGLASSAPIGLQRFPPPYAPIREDGDHDHGFLIFHVPADVASPVTAAAAVAGLRCPIARYAVVAIRHDISGDGGDLDPEERMRRKHREKRLKKKSKKKQKAAAAAAAAAATAAAAAEKQDEEAGSVLAASASASASAAADAAAATPTATTATAPKTILSGLTQLGFLFGPIEDDESAVLSPELGDGGGSDGGAAARAGMEAALCTWRTHYREATGLSGDGGGDSVALHELTQQVMAAPSFRASVVRCGRHTFNSNDCARMLGAAVIHYTGWKVDLTKFHLEVVGLLVGPHLVVGLSLFIQPPVPPPKEGGDANDGKAGAAGAAALASAAEYRRDIMHKGGKMMCEPRPEGFQVPAVIGRHYSLRPSTTYTLLRLACLKPGDIVLDTMAGVGTVPSLAGGAAWPASSPSSSLPCCFGLGGEIDVEALELAGMNCARPVCRTGRAGVVGWDATAVPLRDACVDGAVVDLPFGMSCGSSTLIHSILPKVLAELFRVVRVGGRAVLLSAQPKLLDVVLGADKDGKAGGAKSAASSSISSISSISSEEKQRPRSWEALGKHSINLGGIPFISVYVLVKR